MSYDCPRCTEPLEEAEMLGTEIMRCNRECGLIVAQNRMVPFTTSLAEALYATIDRHEAIPPCEPDGRSATCPGCSKPMETFGYMESRFAWLDRCSSCQVIWIDREELDMVVKMAAKTVKQQEHHFNTQRELHESLSRLVWVTSDDLGFLSFRGRGRPR